jgi:hypothetical protein
LRQLLEDIVSSSVPLASPSRPAARNAETQLKLGSILEWGRRDTSKRLIAANGGGIRTVPACLLAFGLDTDELHGLYGAVGIRSAEGTTAACWLKARFKDELVDLVLAYINIKTLLVWRHQDAKHNAVYQTSMKEGQSR